LTEEQLAVALDLPRVAAQSRESGGVDGRFRLRPQAGSGTRPVPNAQAGLPSRTGGHPPRGPQAIDEPDSHGAAGVLLHYGAKGPSGQRASETFGVARRTSALFEHSRSMRGAAESRNF